MKNNSLILLTSTFHIDIEPYKPCFTDYVHSIGPFGSPFTFLSYGISYPEIVNFAMSSVDFLNFVFLSLIKSEKVSEMHKILDFLKDCRITKDEIKERSEVMLNE